VAGIRTGGGSARVQPGSCGAVRTCRSTCVARRRSAGGCARRAGQLGDGQGPNLGIFYRSPKPGAPPYVELGAEVDEETEICLIEVMKLFTPVHAGLRGTVRHICVEDGEMVDHDQPLFYIEPAA
jgi:biotin carboxyl carrier protein